MLQGFVARETEDLRWGLLYAKQDRGEDPPLELASAFLGVKLDERNSVIGRIDRLIEPSPKGDGISYLPFDPSAPATMYLAGYEFRPRSSLTQTIWPAP